VLALHVEWFTDGFETPNCAKHARYSTHTDLNVRLLNFTEGRSNPWSDGRGPRRRRSEVHRRG